MMTLNDDIDLTITRGSVGSCQCKLHTSCDVNPDLSIVFTYRVLTHAMCLWTLQLDPATRDGGGGLLAGEERYPVSHRHVSPALLLAQRASVRSYYPI